MWLSLNTLLKKSSVLLSALRKGLRAPPVMPVASLGDSYSQRHPSNAPAAKTVKAPKEIKLRLFIFCSTVSSFLAFLSGVFIVFCSLNNRFWFFINYFKSRNNRSEIIPSGQNHLDDMDHKKEYITKGKSKMQYSCKMITSAKPC